MPLDRKRAAAAIELARLTAPAHRGKTRQLLLILADQLEASLRLIESSVQRARERELSAVLNILDTQEVTTDEIELVEAMDEETS